MGITEDNDHEMSRLSNGGDEESLPLYSEVGGAPKEGPMVVPEATATPDEVRDFFKSLIVAKRQDVNGEGAEAIAAKWMRGSGKELKSYPPAMYLKIFGPEDGWFLYKETQLIERKKNEEEIKKTRHMQYVFIAFMVCFELGMLATIIWCRQQVLLVIAIFAGLFGAPVLLVTCAVTFGSTNIEDEIEGELRKCMDRGGDDNK